jgi:hypothetical protein
VGSKEVVVERAETPVMFKRVADEVTAIGRGMQEVEEAVGLCGRKYYGAFNNDSASTASASSYARATTRRRLGWSLAASLAGAMHGNVSQENHPRSTS